MKSLETLRGFVLVHEKVSLDYKIYIFVILRDVQDLTYISLKGFLSFMSFLIRQLIILHQNYLKLYTDHEITAS